MNERDPADLDVKAWGDYWASLKVDAVLGRVTGSVAFYPTKLPNCRRAAFLGDRGLVHHDATLPLRRQIACRGRAVPDDLGPETLKRHRATRRSVRHPAGGGR